MHAAGGSGDALVVAVAVQALLRCAGGVCVEAPQSQLLGDTALHVARALTLNHICFERTVQLVKFIAETSAHIDTRDQVPAAPATLLACSDAHCRPPPPSPS